MILVKKPFKFATETLNFTILHEEKLGKNYLKHI